MKTFAPIALFRTLFLFLFLFLFPTTILAQNSELDSAFAAFKSGNCENAIKLLKGVVKKNGSDAGGWALLGVCYLQKHKMKDAVSTLKNAVDLEPKNAVYWAKYAYALGVRNDNSGFIAARKAVELDPKLAEGHYLCALFEYRFENYKAAYDFVQKSLSLQPDYVIAHLLKTHILIASFSSLLGKVVAPGTPTDLLPQAAKAFERYVQLSPDLAHDRDLLKEVQDLNWFANYYEQPEHRLTRDASESVDSEKATSLKLLSKPRPNYPSLARENGTEGTVVLLASFKSNGEMGPIIVLKSVSDSIDRESIRAARLIKFTPATAKGVSVDTVKRIEYGFSIR